MEQIEQQIIREAVKSRATDIHIDPMLRGYHVRYRVDGFLRLVRTLQSDEGERLINQIKADVGIEPGTIFSPRGERKKLDVGGKIIDLRVTLAPCVSGPKIAVRILDPERIERRIPNLGLDSNNQRRLEEWIAELNGMFLVTGPTASGKTTTLYALLHELVEESRHVVTIEDPVEYEIDGINQMQVDERHGLDFAEGVQTSLRLDPDCLMVGEIREPNAAFQATSAAVQGHIVMATLHSRDAVSAITRLRNFRLEDYQIAASVGVVVNQRLVRKLCPSCRKEDRLTETEMAFLQNHGIEAPEHNYTASGCGDCDETGYHDRTGIFEVWNLDTTDYEMILAGADEESLRRKLRLENHRSLLGDALSKIEAGVTSLSEVVRLGLELPWEND